MKKFINITFKSSIMFIVMSFYALFANGQSTDLGFGWRGGSMIRCPFKNAPFDCYPQWKVSHGAPSLYAPNNNNYNNCYLKANYIRENNFEQRSDGLFIAYKFESDHLYNITISYYVKSAPIGFSLYAANNLKETTSTNCTSAEMKSILDKFSDKEIIIQNRDCETTSYHKYISDEKENWSPQKDYQYIWLMSNQYYLGQSGTLLVLYVYIEDLGLQEPYIPTSFKSSEVTNNSCLLSWKAPDGTVTGYYVYQDGIRVNTTSLERIEINNLEPNTTYTFAVSAYNSVGESKKTSINVLTLPEAPTNLTSNLTSCSECTLEWEASSGIITKYKIYQDGEYIGSTTSTTYNVDSLEAGTYSFRISAVNSTGESSKSSSISLETTETPEPPTEILISVYNSQYVVMHWKRSTSNDVISYRVSQVCPSNGVDTMVTSTSIYLGTLNSFRDNYAYMYSVSSYNGYCSSTLEGAGITIHTKPTNLTANNITNSSCLLSWKAPDGTVTGYYVYQDGIKVGTTSLKSIKINNLRPNTTYTFAVSAYNDNGESGKTTVTVTTLPNASTVPSNLIVSNIGCHGCLLTWDALSGVASGYKVYINGSLYKTTSSNSIEIDGLESSTSYSLSVVAYNGTEDSEMSKTVEFSTLVTPSTPLAFNVNNITTDDNFRTSCSFVWYPCGYSDDVVFILYYKIENALITKFNISKSDMPFTLKKLSPDYIHSFCLTAYNGVCESSPTKTIFVNTKPTTISAPTNFDFAQLTHTSCTLHWSPPQMYVNGYYVYVMDYYSGSVISKISTKSTSCVINNLDGTYNFAVTAYNCIGESDKSDILTCRFPLYNSAGIKSTEAFSNDIQTVVSEKLNEKNNYEGESDKSNQSALDKDAVIESVGSRSNNTRTVNKKLNRKDISLYPNPINDIIYVNGIDVFNYTIYSLYGRIIQKESDCCKSIDVSHVKSGVYIIEIKSEKYTYRQKIEKR